MVGEGTVTLLWCVLHVLLVLGMLGVLRVLGRLLLGLLLMLLLGLLLLLKLGPVLEPHPRSMARQPRVSPHIEAAATSI